MASYLLVIGDRNAVGWILTEQRMAFPSARRSEVGALRIGDELFLYTTRAAFKNPTRDRGRVIGSAHVVSPVETLGEPMRFGDRMFPVGCGLEINRLAPYTQGIELAPLASTLRVFEGAPNSWSVRLRRPLLRLPAEDAEHLRRQLGTVGARPTRDLIDPYARWFAATVT
jgi:hypothetical protein